VKNGKPMAVITLPANATKHATDAANLLSEYIEKSTGAKIPVVKSTTSGKISVHVSEDNYVRSLDLDIKSLDGDGFVIAFPDKKNIVITGPTDWGTEFGVYDFLERY